MSSTRKTCTTERLRDVNKFAKRDITWHDKAMTDIDVIHRLQQEYVTRQPTVSTEPVMYAAKITPARIDRHRQNDIRLVVVDFAGPVRVKVFYDPYNIHAFAIDSEGALYQHRRYRSKDYWVDRWIWVSLGGLRHSGLMDDMLHVLRLALESLLESIPATS